MNGYIIKYMPEHPRTIGNSGSVYEHILIAEQKLGRSLKEGEVVHHIDENRSNNNPDNLLVFKTKADHTRFHKTGIKILEGDVYISPENICIDCGKIIDNHTKVQRCLLCSHKAQRKVERPAYDQLLIDKQNMSMCAIGRKYGVSDNAVRKWIKWYEKNGNIAQ